MSSYFVACFLALSSLLWSQPSVAHPQQPASGNQETPTPGHDPMEWIKSQVIQNAEKAGCGIGACKILVTNFTLRGGASSLLGHRLADSLCAQLSEKDGSFVVVDRSQYQTFLSEEGLSARSQNDSLTARWIARQLKANAVITGEIAKTDEKEIEVKIQLLDAKLGKQRGFGLKQKFTVNLSDEDISAPYYPSNPAASMDSINGETIYSLGRDRTLPPACYHMPNPPYTQEARDSRFSGTILIEAVVGADGKLHALQVMSGAPYGLSRVSIETLKTWRCKPALKDGKPVPVRVPFDVNFRLYP